MKKLTIASAIALIFSIGLIAQDGAQVNIGAAFLGGLTPFIGPSGITNGPILCAADTATAPCHSWAADSNTGMYNSAPDNIGWSLAGSNRMTLFGLGTLDIAGAIRPGGDLVLVTGSLINWNSDTFLSRNAPGVINVTSGYRAPFYTSPASSVLTITTNVITPTNSIHHLGAGLVKTITVPTACANTCTIDIVPDAAFTTDATGNISLASIAAINRTIRFTWDGTKWNPSY